MVTLDYALVREYEKLYSELNINSGRVDDTDGIIDKIVQNKPKYKAVEREVSVPWFFIAAIHSLESSLKFNAHLHNGDPLTGRTTRVPAGRIPGKNPPYTWEESTIDALEFNGTADWNDWSIAGICYRFEKYNGFGYRIYHPEVKSPYLWSFSNQYVKGKYGSDGKFDPNLVSQQCGGMVLLKRMEERGLISLTNPPSEHKSVTWLELYRKEEDSAIFPVLAAWATSELIESIELKNRSVEDLVDFCQKYPTAKTFHVANSNKTPPSSQTSLIIDSSVKLPILKRILRWSAKGKDVEALQKKLNALGLNAGAVDGEFGDQTEGAVKAYQLRKGLLVDGEVGSITWQSMGGEFEAGNMVDPSDPLHLKLAAFASVEAAKNLRWNGANSEAEKYLAPLRQPMRDLNQIGTAIVHYDWCAAFITYCCREVGLTIPDRPSGFWATMALVASWEYWAKQQGYWHPKGTTKPRRGDIVTLDWSRVKGKFNHIGVVRGYTSGSSRVQTGEGNTGNSPPGQTGHRNRSLSSISGIIRIR